MVCKWFPVVCWWFPGGFLGICYLLCLVCLVNVSFQVVSWWFLMGSFVGGFQRGSPVFFWCSVLFAQKFVINLYWLTKCVLRVSCCFLFWFLLVFLYGVSNDSQAYTNQCSFCRAKHGKHLPIETVNRSITTKPSYFNGGTK